MNWPYLHILINHFPIILTVVGSAVLALALVVPRRGLWLHATATLTLAGAAIYPVYFTGDRAGHATRTTWYIVRDMVREHDASAAWALGASLLLGVVSAYWWRRLATRGETPALSAPPLGWRVALAILAALALSIITRTAYLGGRIVHDSPKLATPPAGVVSSPPGR